MKNLYVQLASSAIEEYVKNGKIIDIPRGLTKEMLGKQAGVFVSIHKKHEQTRNRETRSDTKDELRGCIGTFLPTKKNIAKEIIDNAISAATRDYRFPPVSIEELLDLEISVDVLGKPETIQKISSLDPKRYGVIVKSKDDRIGLLLPNLEGVNTPEEQIAIACQKADIVADEDLLLCRFEVMRHKKIM